MKELFINDDGIALHAKLEMPDGVGKRCPLCIVVHGLTGHMEERHILAVSKAMREVGVATLRVEMYGHGGSGGSFAKHTLYKWIDNLLAVIDYAKGLDFATKLYLAGHSQGGLTTMLVGALRHDDLAAIMPLSPACVIVDGARSGSMLCMTFDPEHVPDVVWMGDPALVEGDRSARAFCGDYFRLAQTLDVDRAIRSYDGPVLLVHGTADESVPVQYSVDAAQRYASAQLRLIEDDTHCYDLHLDQVCEAVKDFLREL